MLSKNNKEDSQKLIIIISVRKSIIPFLMLEIWYAKRKSPHSDCKYLGHKGDVFLWKFCSKHKCQIITKTRKNISEWVRQRKKVLARACACACACA